MLLIGTLWNYDGDDDRAKVQVTGHRLQVTGQVTGHRSQVGSQATGQVTGHTQKQ